MRIFFGLIAAVALGIGFGDAEAKSHDGNASASAPVAHNSSSSTTATPHFNSAPRIYSGGVPHNYSGSVPYRANINYHNGNRTFNYPAVGVSNVHRSTLSGGNNFNSARTPQRSGGNLQHAAARNIAPKNKLHPQTSSRLRNWNGNITSASQARLNHVNNCHHHHGSNWWHN